VSDNEDKAGSPPTLRNMAHAIMCEAKSCWGAFTMSRKLAFLVAAASAFNYSVWG
jgi:hypothetical protein